MAKYKVLRGTHQVMTVVEKKGGVPSPDVKTFRAGDIFEVPEGRNYSKRIARIKSKRFLEVPDDTPVSNPEDTALEDLGPPEKSFNQILEATQEMTVADLKELAATNGVDLTGATRRDEILKRIQEKT